MSKAMRKSRTLVLGQPHRPHVVLSVREFLGPNRVGDQQLEVWGLTARDLIELIQAQLDPHAALSETLTKLRAPNGGRRSPQAMGGKASWAKANRSPAARAKRIAQVSKAGKAF